MNQSINYNDKYLKYKYKYLNEKSKNIFSIVETFPSQNLHANSERELLCQKPMIPLESLAFGKTNFNDIHSYFNDIHSYKIHNKFYNSNNNIFEGGHIHTGSSPIEKFPVNKDTSDPSQKSTNIISNKHNKYKIVFIQKIQNNNDWLYISLIYLSLNCTIYYKYNNIFTNYKNIVKNIIHDMNYKLFTPKKLFKNIKIMAHLYNVFGYDSNINDAFFHIPNDIQLKIFFYKKKKYLSLFIQRLQKKLLEYNDNYLIYYKKYIPVGTPVNLNNIEIINKKINGLHVNKTDIAKFNEKYNIIAFDNKTSYVDSETDFLIVNSYNKNNKCIILFGYLNDNEFNTLTGFLDFPGYLIVFRDKHNTWYSNSILDFENIIKSFIFNNKIDEITFFGSSMGGYAAIYMAIKIKNSVCIALSPQTFNNINNKNIYFANEIVLVEHTSHIIFDLHSLYDQFYNDNNSIIYIIIGRNECNEFKINKSQNKMFMDGMHSGILFGKKNIYFIITNRTFHSIFRGLKKDKICNMINLFHAKLMKMNCQIIIDNLEYYDAVKKIDN